MHILWLRPSKPENVSVGRERVASVLRASGDKVKIMDVNNLNVFRVIHEGIKGNCDVVVGTVRIGLYVGAIISMLGRLPLLADVTDPIEQVSDLPRPAYLVVQFIERMALKYADARIFLYDSSVKWASDRGITGLELDNGVQFEMFATPNEERKNEAIELLGPDFDLSRQTAIYIGGLEPKYHIEIILQTAMNLSEWNFVFVGDGSLSEMVRESAEKHQNVYYPGSVRYELIPGMLAMADIGLCLVDAEQPLKVLEYGAAGLPTIALEGELEGRFSDDALYYIKPTPNELMEALQTLASSPNKAELLRNTLRDEARGHSWEEIASSYRELLELIYQ